MGNHLSEQQMIEKTKQLRADILSMICEAGSGHPGGSLSCIDIIAVLYNQVLRHDPQNPSWEDRDRFVLSKGHACPALYAALADCGYFGKEHLATLRKYKSILQGHPYMYKTPGLDVSSGSLGQGLSVAVGMALASRLNGQGSRIYCLMGDGEIQEGQIWEAAMSAGHYGLDNLCGIVDNNGLQIDGNVKDVMNINPVVEKWVAFNWNVIRIDGHCPEQIAQAFKTAGGCKGKPTVIVADTVKGKGVSFMENKCGWHGVAPDKQQLKTALDDLI
jgi:transketolase